MGSFVKDTALEYLDDVRPLVRKAASKAVSLLSVKTKGEMDVSLSHDVMYEVLNKLLTIAISDNDMEVREIMLNSLNDKFNIYLKKKSNLQRLILSLNDASDEVQQKTIIILKRLIPNNPSEIIPAL
jgi:serine/threonine-protein kinase mTOR